MKFLIYIAAVWAVAAAAEDKKEKRGLLGLGYGHGAIAAPLSLGPSLSLGGDYGHGIALSAPIAAPISYSAPLLTKTISAPIAAPLISKTIAPVSYSAPISYSAPLSYSSPISYSAPISYASPISYPSPISYSSPLITKSIGAPLLSAPIIKSYAAPAYAAPISLGHGLGYSGISLGYGNLIH